MTYDEECEAVCWVEELADDAVCSLPADHKGKHCDKGAGREWW